MRFIIKNSINLLLQCIILFLFSSTIDAQNASIANTHELTLVFEDNFSGSDLDLDKWLAFPGCYHSRTPDCDNRELQYTTQGHNFEFSGSSVKIVAKEENLGLRLVDGCPPSGVDSATYGTYMMGDGYTNLRPFNYTSVEACNGIQNS